MLRKQLARVAKLEHLRDNVLVKLMILEYAHPRQFVELFHWQAAQDGQPVEISKMEVALRKAASVTESPADLAWTTEFLKRWIRMDLGLLPRIKRSLSDAWWVGGFPGVAIAGMVVDGTPSPKRERSLVS